MAERRRKKDKLVIALAIGVIVLLLVTAVSSTVAVLGVDKAENAAAKAETAAANARRAVERAAQNSATLEDLCQIARNQRHTLVLSFRNSKKYLRSPAGMERSGLNDFVRAISLPQLKARMKAERVPPSCR